MSTFFVDGSTYKNGQPGQDSSYLILCPNGEIIDQVLDTLLAAYERGGEYSLDRQFGDVRSDLENLTITK